MRALWTGALSFGLIYLPIRLYKASEEHVLSFDLLHKKDLSPIRYARICKADGKEIPYEDIVKGYEYQKGDYVILTEEDFKKVNLAKTKLIEITNFTHESEIDTMLYEKPYYIEPEKQAIKAYTILRESLKQSKKVGITKFVLHNKEHLGVIKPHDNLLVLNQLRFQDEIRLPESLVVPAHKVSNKEIEMAKKLIDHLTTHFKPEKFHDTYTDELKEMIEAKMHGKKGRKKSEKVQKPSRVEDIMSLLKDSLEQHQPHRKKSA